MLSNSPIVQLSRHAAHYSPQCCYTRSECFVALQVIKHETQRNRGVLGCSVFGYSDAYLRLRPLLRRFQQLRRSSKHPAQAPELHLISADVSQAYDSINVSKLMSIVEPLLKSPHYLIMKHVEVSTKPVTGDD